MILAMHTGSRPNPRCKQKCAESIRIGLMYLRTNWDWLTIFFHPSNLGSKVQSIIVQNQQTWSHSHRPTNLKPQPNLTSLYKFRLQNFVKSTNFLRHMVHLDICQGALFCHIWRHLPTFNFGVWKILVDQFGMFSKPDDRFRTIPHTFVCFGGSSSEAGT